MTWYETERLNFLLETNPDATIAHVFKPERMPVQDYIDILNFEKKTKQIKHRAFLLAKKEAQGNHQKETFK